MPAGTTTTTTILPLEHVLDHAIRLTSRTLETQVNVDKRRLIDGSYSQHPIFHVRSPPRHRPHVNDKSVLHDSQATTPPHSPTSSKRTVGCTMTMKLLPPNMKDTIPNSPLSPRRRFGRWAVVNVPVNDFDDDPFENDDVELQRIDNVMTTPTTITSTLLSNRRCQTPTTRSRPTTPQSVNPKHFATLQSPPTSARTTRKSHLLMSSPDKAGSSKQHRRRSGSLPRSLIMKQKNDENIEPPIVISSPQSAARRSKYLRAPDGHYIPPPPPREEDSSHVTKDGRHATFHNPTTSTSSHHHNRHHDYTHKHQSNCRWYEGDERMSTKSSCSDRTAACNTRTTSTISSDPTNTKQNDYFGNVSRHTETMFDNVQSPSIAYKARTGYIQRSPTKGSRHYREHRNSDRDKLDGLTGSSHHSKSSASSSHRNSPIITSPTYRKRFSSTSRRRDSLTGGSSHHSISSPGSPSLSPPSNSGGSHSGSHRKTSLRTSHTTIQLNNQPPKENEQKLISPPSQKRNSAQSRSTTRQSHRSSLSKKPRELSPCDRQKSAPPRITDSTHDKRRSSSRSKKDRRQPRRRSRTPSSRSTRRSRPRSDIKNCADANKAGRPSNALLQEIRALYAAAKDR